MIKQNKVLLEYNGVFNEGYYEELEFFLEALYIEGICDEIESEAYENIKWYGRCTNEEYDYVLETMEIWNEDEYFRRLNEISNH